MGKLMILGILALALAPATLLGQTKAQKLAQKARQLESRMENALNNIHEGAGTDCAFDLGKGSDATSEFIQDVDTLNARRRNEYRRLGLNPPNNDYPYCGDSEEGGPRG